MRHSEVMRAAWSIANDFNTTYPEGTKIQYLGKELQTTGPAYVLANGDSVVTLATVEYPVKLSMLFLPVSDTSAIA